jgi:hypothetical protein
MSRTILCLLALLLLAGAWGSAVAQSDPPYTHDEYIKLDTTTEPWKIYVKPQKGARKTLLVPKGCKVNIGKGSESREALKKLVQKDLVRIDLEGKSNRCKSITKVKPK